MTITELSTMFADRSKDGQTVVLSRKQLSWFADLWEQERQRNGNVQFGHHPGSYRVMDDRNIQILFEIQEFPGRRGARMYIGGRA